MNVTTIAYLLGLFTGGVFGVGITAAIFINREIKQSNKYYKLLFDLTTEIWRQNNKARRP